MLSQHVHESNCKSTFYKEQILEKHLVQVPRWVSNFALEIKTKFKYFSGKVYIKNEIHRGQLILHQELSKIMFKKSRDSTKHVVTLAKIQSTGEASHNL